MKDINTVKVIARARPLLPYEIINKQISCLETITEDSQIVVANEKGFTFDHVFNESSTQDDIYKTYISELVNKVLKGYNATVLAYGQTGTGKTYTMGTDYNSNNKRSHNKMGIVPRVLNDIFDATTHEIDTEYSIKVSFLEIYNKSVYDLLTKEKKQIQIQEQASGVKVPGLRMINVNSVSSALRWLQEGCITRTTAATSMNLNSSRSHAIFTVYVQCRNNQELVSKLHLVDLAGSETVHTSEADRFKEGVNINLGLLALERVISALCRGSHQISHVPYRSSALTHLLKDCLNGESFTVMIVCVSPAHSSMLETINTLRYAARARCIKSKPVKNKFTQLENSVVKKKFHSIPQTPYIPCPSNQDYNLTMMSPSSLVPGKKPRLTCTVAATHASAEDIELVPEPAPLLFSPSPNDNQNKLCKLTENEGSTHNVPLPTCISSPTIAEETKWNATFQPDISVMISPVVQKVCSQIDKAVGKKFKDLEKRILEQMEENRSVVFKQNNHTLLLTPLQTTMLGQLKKKIDESAHKYFSPLANETSFTPLKNRNNASFALTPRRFKTQNNMIAEIPENTCITPEQKTPKISPEFKENSNTVNITKSTLKEKNQNFPRENRRKILRRRTVTGFSQRPTMDTRSRKETTSYDNVKNAITINKKLQKKHNKEVLKILNTGTAKDLQAMPLIGGKTAQILLIWREFRGPFLNISNIKNVQGLPKTFFQRFIKANLLTED